MDVLSLDAAPKADIQHYLDRARDALLPDGADRVAYRAKVEAAARAAE
ncbi:hypothetical protein [Tsukamurella ocularis]|nr:hypothetical protein [Tsukamurella ocularis]MCS3779071.1 hypothetical protein [Tsukamurella ocularis]MCS3787309.1 hypothetical protein [Tsukamurella ocularis]MCS3851754.1 hypothetical protein [Tsukamurella ocularis]